MSEIRAIRVQSLKGELDTLTVEVADSALGSWLSPGWAFIIARFMGRICLTLLLPYARNSMKRAGGCFAVVSRFDVFPSGMSQSMGSARKVYITRLGAPATDLI